MIASITRPPSLWELIHDGWKVARYDESGFARCRKCGNKLMGGMIGEGSIITTKCKCNQLNIVVDGAMYIRCSAP